MMKQLLTFKSFVTLPVLPMLVTLVGTVPVQAAGLPMVVPQVSHLLVTAAADCAAAGQKVAASQGGTLTKATPAVQNGRSVCVVVVLVPGRDGERPRRVEVAVPAE